MNHEDGETDVIVRVLAGSPRRACAKTRGIGVGKRSGRDARRDSPPPAGAGSARTSRAFTVWSLSTSSCTGLSFRQYSRRISMVRTIVSPTALTSNRSPPRHRVHLELLGVLEDRARGDERVILAHRSARAPRGGYPSRRGSRRRSDSRARGEPDMAANTSNRRRARFTREAIGDPARETPRHEARARAAHAMNSLDL